MRGTLKPWPVWRIVDVRQLWNLKRRDRRVSGEVPGMYRGIPHRQHFLPRASTLWGACTVGAGHPYSLEESPSPKGRGRVLAVDYSKFAKMKHRLSSGLYHHLRSRANHGRNSCGPLDRPTCEDLEVDHGVAQPVGTKPVVAAFIRPCLLAVCHCEDEAHFVEPPWNSKLGGWSLRWGGALALLGLASSHLVSSNIPQHYRGVSSRNTASGVSPRLALVPGTEVFERPVPPLPRLFLLI